MDLPNIACRDDGHTGFIQFVSISLTLVSERIVLFGLNKSRRQAAQLVEGGTQRRDVGIVSLIFPGCVDIPPNFIKSRARKRPMANS